ncbi:lasso peptide biosynthesis PqqD family chaperone [Streptomyces sp. JJ36]|uniref:lasso peptide biosynthesis PqqD family chaperone n=1 Tax=Streptomyces sp. JJ36 TaxID=2736645 RepID=UPI001F30D19E|nr:lasso peptide biosynthesis PqqD family chaperone [Streptomyces sp. JJ36]MCF6523394.1 lasso peptide biosynthesis PqqD family chaperone [Streptomyces sp. JJ36]
MALRLRPDISTAETEYGTVLLDERSGHYWELNPTGTLVIRKLLAGADEAAAADALVAQYDVDPADAAEDVAALVQELRTAGLAA